ncbi:XkdT Uncharacterized homolog of phage Mu protein gp47 [uncultured Caudovirales phage]|uniref:XkdT Uncharacterized homolog of phage Mu protein gp47 n=1 Tax=uncultured Caudovirales phage TaxID=2100421 RepID=A0A6J5M9M0_9CAUD|nr:XkdT Uncharacterized homolog of phage Mu protein gp47 [uncultured Caudovirales phage]CAB4162815.1 XkdT Uncharacterized homolog of phage Mu protein gp47 [uncultured Caudovirales phage]
MPIVYSKSKPEILGRMLLALEKNAGITATYPGAIARAFAESVATEVSDLYETLKFAVDQTAISTASGRSLDLIGELYGVPRKLVSADSEQERSSYNIEFFIGSPSSSDIVITKGTSIYNDVTEFATRQYQYQLESDVTIIAGTTKAYGRITPSFTSQDFTAAKGTLTKHNFISSDGTIVYCSNPKEVYSISGMESDENYRRRISLSIKERSYGTAESLRLNALSLPGVRDVRIRESSYGLGSCDIIVVPESQRIDPSFVQNILDNLSGRKPVGIKLNIRIADRIPINTVVNIVLPQGLSAAAISAIEGQANLFVRRYLNSMTIGSSISYSDIENQVRASSDFIKSVNILSVTSSGQEVPKGIFRLNTEREYMIAGTVSIFSVIMSSQGY